MTTKATISDEAVEAAEQVLARWMPNGCRTAARLALEAAYPHITPHGIGVKGLEWTDYTGLAFRGGASSFGRGAVCLYHAYGDGAWCSDISVDGMRSGGNLASAKAAAQADYETRILSALQRNPEGDVEPVAWRCTQWVDGNSQSMVTEWKETADARRELGEEVQPLYLHPPRTGDEVAKDADKASFARGMAVAAGIVMSCWGDEVHAREILGAAGLTTVRAMRESGVDTYDIRLCMPVLRRFRDKRDRAALSPKAAKGDGV